MITLNMVLRAVTPAGEAALKKYLKEKLTLRERIMAKGAGVKEMRSVTKASPFTVTTKLEITGAAEKVLGKHLDYWYAENAKVVAAKMEGLGAKPSDYFLEVS